MTGAPCDLRDALPRHDPEAARRGNALLRLLNDRRVAGMRASVAIPDRWSRASAQAWLLFRLGPGTAAIAPLMLGGCVPRLTAGDGAPDGLALAATLDALDPLVTLIEEQFGYPLEPLDVAVRCPEDLTIVQLAAAADDAGAPVSMLLAGLPDQPASAGAAGPMGSDAAGLARHARAPACLLLPAAHLTLAEARALAPGDALLLGPGPLVGRLLLPGRTLQGRFDPAGVHGLRIFIEGSGSMTQTTDIPTVTFDTQISIPIEAVVGVGAMTLLEAAALAPGTYITVPGRAPTLPVVLRLGGADLASGELVAVGDGYAILVRSVNARDQAPPSAAVEPA